MTIEAALERQGLLRRGKWSGDASYVPNHSPDWVAVQQAVLGTAVMEAAREQLASVVAEALGTCVTPRHADIVRVFAPGSYETTPAHQDAFYFREAPPNLVAWVALTEPDRGGLEVFVPERSLEAVIPHRRMRAPAAYLETLPAGTWSRPRLQPGDAIVFDVLTIHRGTANRAGGPRISVDVRFDATLRPSELTPPERPSP